MHRIIIIGICLSLLACSRIGDQKTIPRDDFVSLLVDLHVYDAVALNATVKDLYGQLDSALLYGTILEKHGYTKQQLFATFKSYTDEPEELMLIYDEVFATLSRLSEEAKAEYNKYSAENTIHVWRPNTNRYTIEGKEEEYPGTFTIEIDTLGTYVISLNITISEKDKSKNPRVVAYFFKSEADNEADRLYFEEIELLKSRYGREIIRLYTLEEPGYDRLKLIIPKHDNQDSLFFKDMDMYNLRVSRMKPEETEKEDS